MLTVPLALAALGAGLAGGVHCIGMCGGISTMLTQVGKNQIIPITSLASIESAEVNFRNQAIETWRYSLLLQSGRIFTYMLIGALFGSIGAAGMVFKSSLPFQRIFFVFGNLALIFLGLRLFQISLNLPVLDKFIHRFLGVIHSFSPALKKGGKYPFLLGMSWGCLPCGLLYTVAPFALLSGSAISGALLMCLFGVAALPHLLFAQTLFSSGARRSVSSLLRKIFATLLITIGLLGLWYFDMKGMPDFLCVTPIN